MVKVSVKVARAEYHILLCYEYCQRRSARNSSQIRLKTNLAIWQCGFLALQLWNSFMIYILGWKWECHIAEMLGRCLFGFNVEFKLYQVWILLNLSLNSWSVCIISITFTFHVQGDPNQYPLFQMAAPLKLCISDPMLIKPKCVWEAVVFFNFRKFVYIFQLFVYNFLK